MCLLIRQGLFRVDRSGWVQVWGANRAILWRLYAAAVISVVAAPIPGDCDSSGNVKLADFATFALFSSVHSDAATKFAAAKIFFVFRLRNSRLMRIGKRRARRSSVPRVFVIEALWEPKIDAGGVKRRGRSLERHLPANQSKGLSH